MSSYLYGLLDLGFWGYVGVTLVMVQISMMAVTLYLHRDQAHRAIDLHPVLKHFFRVWIWLTSGMDTGDWVAVHRKHHAFVEQNGDPHSPVVFGLRKVLLEGTELYRAEARNPRTYEKYSHGTPRDWLERKLYRRSSIGITLMLLIDLLLFGVPGIIVYSIQMLTMPIFAAGVINGLGHATGYRNFQTDDASTNLYPWGILIGGEELHNNHHAFPTAAKFSVRTWEFDLGWMYICILRALRLCRVRRVAPAPRFARTSRPVDIDVLRAVMYNRMHILREYTRRVTLPVLRLEKKSQRGNRLLARARRLLLKWPGLLDDQAKSRLSQLLEENQALRTVQEYREQLACLWQQANVSNEKLVRQLRDWCASAEASGIQALQEFSARLRGCQPAVA